MTWKCLELIGEMQRSGKGRLAVARGDFAVDFGEPSPCVVIGFAHVDDTPEATARRIWKRGVRIPVSELEAVIDLLNAARP